jgi:glycine dehydrogenase subunit 2
LLIEPTESESRETLDGFVDAMVAIAEESRQDPERQKNAPYKMPVRRLDDVKAAKHLDLAWRPEAQ